MVLSSYCGHHYGIVLFNMLKVKTASGNQKWDYNNYDYILYGIYIKIHWFIWTKFN